MIKFYHVLKKSAIKKRALICYNERMYVHPCASQSTKGWTKGGRCRFLFLFSFLPGVALVLDLFLLVIFYFFLSFFVLARTFSFEFRLAQFLAPKISNSQSPTKLGQNETENICRMI